MSRGVRASRNAIEAVNLHIYASFQHQEETAPSDSGAENAPFPVLRNEAAQKHQVCSLNFIGDLMYVVTILRG
ncbi:hypothetical protein M2416_001927 [Raoultella sp. BIGb0132]|nr:hypothetical protein [Raoultella sp. BIGb0132]MCS4288234.1 hypothetical protein [Raoultella terrigena]